MASSIYVCFIAASLVCLVISLPAPEPGCKKKPPPSCTPAPTKPPTTTTTTTTTTKPPTPPPCEDEYEDHEWADDHGYDDDICGNPGLVEANINALVPVAGIDAFSSGNRMNYQPIIEAQQGNITGCHG